MSDYDNDLMLWSRHRADLLRRVAAGGRVNDQIDWENVAEEIESLRKRERRELSNRVRVGHPDQLIKLLASPATQRRPNWHETIIEQHAAIRTLLDDSPSLRPRLVSIIGKELPPARMAAAGSLVAYNDPAQLDPVTLNFTEDQVLGPWLPQPAAVESGLTGKSVLSSTGLGGLNGVSDAIEE